MSAPVVFNTLADAREHGKHCALAIGNFDGVHLGHQALLARTIAFAQEAGAEPAVLTFDPHPTTVVAPERVPLKIYSLEERIGLLGQAGVRSVTVLPFTPEIARLPPHNFVEDVLVNALRVGAVFVGENFRFGHQQAGTPQTLAALGQQFRFQPFFLPPVIERGEIVSSSAIRRYLAASEISRANRLLGRCFSLAGAVVSGHGIGSKQTVPTLNLRPGVDRVIPRGVFITETVETGTGRRWDSITNCGVRPTFAGEEFTVETFLLSRFEPPVPEHIEVHFRRLVRAERAFPDPAALREQIMRDVGRAKAYWRRMEWVNKRMPSIY